MNLGQAIVEVVADLGKLARRLQEAKAQVAREMKRAGEMGKRAFAQGLRGLGKVVKKALLGIAAVASMVGVGAGIALRASEHLNEAMANVASLGREAAAHVEEWKGELQDLSVQMGKTTDDLAAGLYQVVSAFGPADDTMQVLAINAKAAAAGLARTADAINLTSAVTKAYGDTSAKAVQQVADLALKTVQLGQTTFPELAQSIGRVTPLASAMGVTMQDLFAVMATATGVTGDAAEVSTQFRAALQALMAPTDALAKLMKSLGYENGQAMIQTLGFGGAMKVIVDAAKKSGRPLQDFIGQIRGQVLALALANGLSDQYVEKLQAMQHAAGATEEAFKAQTQGIARVSFLWKQLKQRVMVFLQKAGDMLAPFVGMVLERLVPALDAWAGKVEAVLEAFHDLLTGSKPLSEVHDRLVEVFGKRMGERIFGFIDGVRQLVNGLRDGGLTGKRFRDALARVFGPEFVSKLDAFVAGFQRFRDVVVQVWWAVSGFVRETLIPFIQQHGKELLALLAGIGAVLAGAAIVGTIASIGAAVAALANPLTLVAAAVGLLAAAWAGNWGGIRDKLTAVWNAIQPILASLWNWLQTNIPQAVETLRSFWEEHLMPALQTAWDFVQNELLPTWQMLWQALQDIGDWIADRFVAIWQNVLQPALEDLWSFVQEKLAPIWDTLWGKMEDLQRKVDPFKRVWDGVRETFAGLWEKVKSVVDKVTELADLLEKVDLPWWMVRHSPAPIELVFEGWKKHLRDVNLELPRLEHQLAVLDRAGTVNQVRESNWNITIQQVTGPEQFLNMLRLAQVTEGF